MGWIEDAPRRVKYQIVPTTAVSNIGVVPVLGMAFQDGAGETTTLAFMATVSGLKKFRADFLRAYDEALRQVTTVQKSIRDAAKEES